MMDIINFKVKEAFELGLQMQKEKNFKEAIKYYEKVIKIDPSIVFAYYNLGLIYEKLGNLEVAKEYYHRAINSEPLFVHSYTNLGIISQKEGAKEKAIEYFGKVIDIDPNNFNSYNNLGLVYASLGKYDKAVDSYFKSLKIKENNIVAIKSLIFLLTYYIPETNHPLVKANNKLRLLQKKYSLTDLLKTNTLSLILRSSLNILNNLSININNLDFFETQAYRRNPRDLNCDYHHKVFNQSKIIPKFCFACFKIQIEPKNVLDLIRLFFIFDNLKLSKNNQRKCMVEFRNEVSGLYKGMIYCASFEEAKEILLEITPKLKNNLEFKAEIKRGCSEFYNLFPNYKVSDPDNRNFMDYDKNWEQIEENTKITRNFNTIKLNNSVSGLSISDFLIIIQWLNYAKMIGDLTYKEINLDFFNSRFIDHQLMKQVEFRKKEFNNI
tara:strand:+ start:47 stop:1360 length:1314 start_codon:yes stop_codon:yes gene_type:complete